MKIKILNTVLLINLLVGIFLFLFLVTGVYQTIVIPEEFDSFSALLLVISGVPCLLGNFIITYILRRYKKQLEK